jgi:hypothetical protein
VDLAEEMPAAQADKNIAARVAQDAVTGGYI